MHGDRTRSSPCMMMVVSQCGGGDMSTCPAAAKVARGEHRVDLINAFLAVHVHVGSNVVNQV